MSERGHGAMLYALSLSIPNLKNEVMKKAIALLINDIHVSKDNIQEFNRNWEEMMSICKQKGIGNVIIGGDMFTSRASQTLATLLAVKHNIAKLTAQGISLIIAEGNHDKVDTEAIEGYNHLWVDTRNVSVVDSYTILDWEDADFVLLTMSYFPENGSFIERLDKAVEQVLAHSMMIKSKADIILYIHEGVHGALGDFEIEGELPQEPLLGFKAVLCGHYHNRTKIKGTNIEYIGSSRQHNFGEDEEKGYTILYSDGTYEFVKNEVNTRYRTVEISATDLEGLHLESDPRYKNRIKVKCSEADAKQIDKQRLFDKGFDKVEIATVGAKETAVSDLDIQAKYDKHGIRKEYQNYCDENSIESELGMKYLGQ